MHLLAETIVLAVLGFRILLFPPAGVLMCQGFCVDDGMKRVNHTMVPPGVLEKAQEWRERIVSFRDGDKA